MNRKYIFSAGPPPRATDPRPPRPPVLRPQPGLALLPLGPVRRVRPAAARGGVGVGGDRRQVRRAVVRAAAAGILPRRHVWRLPAGRGLRHRRPGKDLLQVGGQDEDPLAQRAEEDGGGAEVGLLLQLLHAWLRELCHSLQGLRGAKLFVSLAGHPV